MFVLISMHPSPKADGKYKISQILLSSEKECILGLFTTKELAIQGILTYAGTLHAGKTALIYEMLPDGVRQKRVKIYEGSFPLYAPESCTKQEPSVIPENTMHTRIQKLEEKLEAKCAELNNLKNDNREMSSLILRMKELIQV